MKDSVEILLSATSGTEALRRLLAWNRARDSKWSYAWIAKQLGMSSKGHIADLLSGRRILVQRLWEPCLKILGLKGMSLKYCRVLLSLEEQILAESEVLPSAYAQLAALRKGLQGQLQNYSERIVSNHMILQVHSAFGLFQNQPTQRQLIQFFGREHVIEVDHALHILIIEGIIERTQLGYRMRPEAQNVLVLGPKPQTEQIIQFLQQGLDQSKIALEKWARNSDLACFRSAHVSVKKKAYASYLDTIRDEMLRMQNEMATDEGDMLVRIDFQIYPIGEK